MAKPIENSVALLVALVPYAVAEGVVAVRDAAAHFGVTEERIRAAVELIFMSGVPDRFGDVHRFDIDFDAFYDQELIQFTDLPALEAPLRLAPREAGAILAGLSLVAGTDAADPAALASLREKLRRASVGAQDTLVADERPADAVAQRIRDAIGGRIVLHVDYRKPSSATSTRRVAPMRLELRDGEAYLRGWDLDREAERTFRLDRMESVRLCDDEYPASIASREPRPLLGEVEGDATVRISATPAAAALLSDYASGDRRHVGDRVHLTVRVWNEASVIRRIASLGGDAVIMEPESARAAVRAFALDALAAARTRDA